MAHRLLCSFHPSGQQFAIVSHDQRLKIFSVLTQQLQQDLTEPQHLTHHITAIAYPQSASSSKSSHLVAVGTKSGEILLWNTKKGEIEHKIGGSTGGAEKHQAAITSLAFHASGTFLFSASADKTIKQWNVSNGSFIASFKSEEATSAFSQIAASGDGNFFVAGGTGSLVLWHISSPGAPIREYQGPTERIVCVAFSPDSKYIVSGNANDRYLSLWSAEAENENDDGHKKKKKKESSKQSIRTTPIHTITLPSSPIHVQFNNFSQSKNTYQIGTLSDSSIVSLVQWSPATSSSTSSTSSSSSAASTPQTTITIPAANNQSEAAKRRDAAYDKANKHNKHKATAASSTLLSGEQGDTIGAGSIQGFQFESTTKMTLARGDAVRPQFESVEFKKGDAFESSIVLTKFQSQHLMNNSSNTTAAATNDKKRKAAASAISNEAVTLGAQHMGDQVQAASSALDGESAKKKAKLANTKSKSDALSRSLADRLAESEQQATNGSALFNLATGELPKAGSLQTILQQALHSNDTTLVEYCLTAGAQQQASNANLIRLTVKRLSPVYILPLLNHLMSKFASRPNRSAALLPWLREVFKNHTAYLIRQPQLTHKLAPLYHLLDTRLSVFKKLLKLQGRLELLLSQISSAKNPGADAGEDEDAGEQGPLNTFNDGEGEEEDEEDDEQTMSDDEDDDGDEDDVDMDEDEDEDDDEGDDQEDGEQDDQEEEEDEDEE